MVTQALDAAVLIDAGEDGPENVCEDEEDGDGLGGGMLQERFNETHGGRRVWPCPMSQEDEKGFANAIDQARESKGTQIVMIFQVSAVRLRPVTMLGEDIGVG